ncbi:MAG: dTMP kinase [Motilibacteraceae bacterium]
MVDGQRLGQGLAFPAGGAAAPVGDHRGLRRALDVPAFRHLWVALSLSSLGDWLGLLALTALAAALSGGGYAQANLAVAGVFVLRLAPAVLLGPLAGVVADRLDRRWTMVAGDLARFALFASIPLVGTLWWVYVATFLVECAAMFWMPAKEASVPNLVPRDRLEAANQLSLLGTYGSAPVAAVLFALLTLLSGPLSRLGLGSGIGTGSGTGAVDVAIWFDALTFLVSAVVISRLSGLPTPSGPRGGLARPGIVGTVTDGWRFIGATPVVRGLVLGMLGAGAAGGAVVGLARTHVVSLGGGDPGYGVLFGAVFVGLAGGMVFGPRLLHGLSRRRVFGLSIAAAGVSLVLLAGIPDLVLTAAVTLALGAFAGIAWVTGYTLIGLEVSDEVRGRTFAFVQAMLRIVLVLVLAVAPLLAAGFGRHEVGPFTYDGAVPVFVLAGALAVALGVVSFRQMDDRPDVPLLRDVAAALRGHPLSAPPAEPEPGFFVAFEGGEGAGKSTQVRQLAAWLQGKGHEVVLTREPGGTPLGQQVRALLLDPASGRIAERSEALLYAADRAHHVETLVRPGLARGAVVVTDRYVDSSLAYQGAGRALPVDDVAALSAWATGGLVPGLTVVLDVPPEIGLTRFAEAPDRLEAEPLEFHRRVREGFLALAARDPERYLVLDATLPPEQVAAAVRERLEPLLPPSPPERAEAERRAAAEAAARAEAGRAAELERQRKVAAAQAEIEERRRVEAEAAAARDRQEAAERAAQAAARQEQAHRRERERRAEADRRAAARHAARSAKLLAAEQRAAAERERAADEAARRRAQRAEQTRGDRRLELDRLAASLPAAAPQGEAAVAGEDHPTVQLPVARPERAESPDTDGSAPHTRELGLAEELLALGVDDDPLPRSGRRQRRGGEDRP